MNSLWTLPQLQISMGLCPFSQSLALELSVPRPSNPVGLPMPSRPSAPLCTPKLRLSILEVGDWRGGPGQRADGEGRGRRSVPSSSAYWNAGWDSRPWSPHTPLSLTPPPPVWIVYCYSFYVLEKVSTTKAFFVPHPSASWPHPGPPTPPHAPSSCSQASRLSDLLVWPQEG